MKTKVVGGLKIIGGLILVLVGINATSKGIEEVSKKKEGD